MGFMRIAKRLQNVLLRFNCVFLSKQIKLVRVYLLYAYFCVLKCLVKSMHEYICMMAFISQTADRLWPDMTAQRLVTWQPTMLVSYTKITRVTQRSWIVVSYNVHSLTFAVCWHCSRVHTFVLTYLCNLRPPQMLAERTLRWDLVFRDLFTCSLPPPNGVKYCAL